MNKTVHGFNISTRAQALWVNVLCLLLAPLMHEPKNERKDVLRSLVFRKITRGFTHRACALVLVFLSELILTFKNTKVQELQK